MEMQALERQAHIMLDIDFRVISFIFICSSIVSSACLTQLLSIDCSKKIKHHTILSTYIELNKTKSKQLCVDLDVNCRIIFFFEFWLKSNIKPRYCTPRMQITKLEKCNFLVSYVYWWKRFLFVCILKRLDLVEFNRYNYK